MAAIRQSPLRTPKLSEGTQSKSAVQKSNIPRPRSRSPWSPRSAHIEDSDLEYRYEADGRDRRRLVVANAEVIPSSSESDIDTREALKMEDLRFHEGGPWNSAETSRSNVGLGFDFGTAISKARCRRGSGSRHQQEVRHSEQGDLAWNSRTPILSARGTRLAGNRPVQDDNHVRGNTRDSCATLDEEHQRRRAALLGIVSRLELGAGISTLVAGEGEESEYGGEEGFAISGSGEFRDRIAQHEEPNEMSDDGSVYGDADEDDDNTQPSIRRQQQPDEEKPRSSNCMPTFLLSTEDSDHHIHCHTQGHDVYLPDPHLRGPVSSRSSSPVSRIGPRASSRSPIIRNENTNVPIPAALRRHSVYHRSPSPGLHPEAKENTTKPENPSRRSRSPSLCYNQAEKQGTTGSVYAQPHVRTSRCDKVTERSDAVLIAERSHAAAARERHAFGIPPSESVEVYQQRASQLLSHAESNLSSVGSVYWHEEEEELSPGAETLFRKLSVTDIGRRNQSQQVCNFRYTRGMGPTDLALEQYGKYPTICYYATKPWRIVHP